MTTRAAQLKRQGDPFPADRLSDPDDARIGRDFDDVPQEIRPVATARRQQRRVRQRHRGYLQPSDAQPGTARSIARARETWEITRRDRAAKRSLETRRTVSS